MTSIADISGTQAQVYRDFVEGGCAQALYRPLAAQAILNAFAVSEHVRDITQFLAEHWGAQNIGDAFEAAEVLLAARVVLTDHNERATTAGHPERARVYTAAADTLRVMAPVWLAVFAEAALPSDAPRYSLSAPSFRGEGWRVLDTHKGIAVSTSDVRADAERIRDAFNKHEAERL